MGDAEWLIERLGEARCASCGLRYTKGAVRGIGYENDCWVVYVACLGCGAQGIAVSMTRPAKERPATRRVRGAPAFTSDDVLDAHELLASYRGDVHGLFATRATQRAR
jgi:hypothetical protein